MTHPRPSEIVFQVLEEPDGGYVARALGHAIHTEADTIDGVRTAVLDAVRCHFEPDQCPRVVHLHFVRDETLAV